MTIKKWIPTFAGKTINNDNIKRWYIKKLLKFLSGVSNKFELRF